MPAFHKIFMTLCTALSIAAIATAENRKPTLSVSVRPAKTKVRAEAPFEVKLLVVNSSASPQSIRVMNCSWDDHWESSNKGVTWSLWDCTKSFEVAVKLEPGGAYETTLDMRAAGEPGKEVTFKMGFTPIGSKQPIWRPCKKSCVS
jgi:hypothetical protein